MGEKIDETGRAKSASNDFDVLTQVEFAGEKQEEVLQERFRLDPGEFKDCFNKQDYIRKMNWNGDCEVENWGIDRTASEYVTRTASLIAQIDGSAEKEHRLKADHLVYLDKSARPVSWLVDEFWDDFRTTDAEKPPCTYLLIDRVNWFENVGLRTDKDGRSLDTGELLGFNDFKVAAEANIHVKDIAALRGLFIPGGINSTEPDEIMATPTGLEGKNILIIDEVKRTGATLKIAQYLLEKALPEVNSVEWACYWDSGTYLNPQTKEAEMASAPVWYPQKELDDGLGRGVRDSDRSYYEALYEAEPTAENLAKLNASDFIGVPLEGDKKSDDLAREIHSLGCEYRDGHVLLRPPKTYGAERKKQVLEAQGIALKREGDDTRPTYREVVAEIDSRERKYT